MAIPNESLRLAASIVTLLLAIYGWLRVGRLARGYWRAELLILVAGLSSIAVWFFLNWFRSFYYGYSFEHEGSFGAHVSDITVRTQPVIEFLGWMLLAGMLVPPLIWFIRKLSRRTPQGHTA